jgi:exodeoxyribonuclease VII large subunit
VTHVDPAHPDALSIAELYEAVDGALARAFPGGRGVWVRGEVQTLSDRTGNCYIDLVDPDSARDRQAPVLKVKCWRRTWAVVRHQLAREGIELEPGMVVVIRGRLDIYRPRAEVGFVLNEVDVTALLGRLAARRTALVRALEAEGLLERNRRLAVPAVPLRIGLVASPGTEGYRDFLGQLEGSPFAFDVRVSPVTVQGAEAARAVARAFARVARSSCDLVVLVRGGGSRADLAAFDAEPVARAIVGSPFPVWTGIGHTGDQSVADLVANRSFITPTECGRELVERVASWWTTAVAAPADLLVRRAAEALAGADRRSVRTRERLAGTARHLLSSHTEGLERRALTVARCAPRAVVASGQALAARSRRVEPLVYGQLTRQAERLGSFRRLLGAYDVERQLERGYTLTLDREGRLVRSVAGLAAGTALVTRFADGEALSTVETVVPATSAARREVQEEEVHVEEGDSR